MDEKINVFLFDYDMTNIRRILDFFVNQIYKDFKLFIIDNNNQDDSFKLCEIYQRKNQLNLKCIPVNGLQLTYAEKIEKCRNELNDNAYFMILTNEFQINKYDNLFLAMIFKHISCKSDIKYLTFENNKIKETEINLQQINDINLNYFITNQFEILKEALLQKEQNLEKKIQSKILKNSKEIKYDVIVSFTTYKPRIINKKIKDVLQSLLNQKFNGRFKIVMTIHVDDMQYFMKDQLDYINAHNIEILPAKLNLRPHLKYFYCMQKYRKIPIITVDDDCVYNSDLVQSLYDSYIKNPDCVSCRRAHVIKYNPDGTIAKYRTWSTGCGKSMISDNLLATGVGGVLYPPDILKISDNNVNEINKCLTADDIYLKYLETSRKIPVKLVWLGDSYQPIRSEYAASYALCCSDNISNNDVLIDKFLNKKMSKQKLHVIYRVNDIIESVHGKRQFENKIDTIKRCFPTLIQAIKNAEKYYEIKLYIVSDHISGETEKFLLKTAEGTSLQQIKLQTNGNINSFKACYNIAMKQNDKDYILFVEDDYICDKRSIEEFMFFFRMFYKGADDIFINPTTDMGDDRLVHVNMENKYDQTTILPGSRLGLKIFWKQTYHSTSTFAVKLKTLKKYDNVFQKMFESSRLNQYTRNTIFRECPCFQPMYPLMQHYQRSYTMYWFDSRNTENEYTYRNNRISLTKI